MYPKINKTVLMSGADYFNDEFAINSYMGDSEPVNTERAVAEHTAIREALESSGVKVVCVPAPAGCQDGVYTANWALVRGNVAVMASLPNKRKDEEPYAEQVLRANGKTIVKIPEGMKFSGQGDALPVGNYLFTGSNYRTDLDVHEFLAEALGYQVISLQTVPHYDDDGTPVINAVTGWPDSFFYDIDLAISVLRDDLIAWCPEAFTPESQERIHAIEGIEKIEVSIEEAMQGFACNLVSTGEVVVMSADAPNLKAAIEAHGLRTITPKISELAKGGGYIRCTTLTLDNT